MSRKTFVHIALLIVLAGVALAGALVAPRLVDDETRVEYRNCTPTTRFYGGTQKPAC